METLYNQPLRHMINGSDVIHAIQPLGVTLPSLDGMLVTTGYLIHSSLAVVGVHTDRVHQKISWAILLTSIF